MIRILKNGAGVLAAMAAVLGVVGCGDGEGSGRTLALIGSTKQAEPTEDLVEVTQERERLAKLQAITYTRYETGEATQTGEWSPADLGGAVHASCVLLLSLDTSEANTQRLPLIASHRYTEDSCEDHVVGSEAEVNHVAEYVCAAAKLVEIAEASVANVTFRAAAISVGSELSTMALYSIPPQSDANRAGLYAQARKKYFYAAALALELLEGRIDSTSYAPGPGPSRIHPVDLMSDDFTSAQREALARRLADSLAEAIKGYESTTYAAAERSVAVADWQRGTTDSATLAASRTWSGEELSRAAAAHMLVGGSPGLFNGSNQRTDGFCITDAMTPGVRRALAALRESGMPFINLAFLGSNMSALIEGQSCSGSLRERLAAKRKDDRLLGILTAQEAVGATLEEFRIAADYLQQELTAYGYTPFGGTLNQSTLPLTCTDSANAHPSVSFDLAVAMPPQRNNAWFSAIARTGLYYDNPWRFTDLTASGVPEMGLAQGLELIGDRLNAIIDPRWNPWDSKSSALVALVGGPMQSLAPALSHIADVVPGRFRWEVMYDGEHVVVGVEMREPLGTEPLLLVQGHEAAECWSTGTVEGLTQATCPTPIAELPYTQYGSFGYPYWYGTYISYYQDTLGDSKPLYVIGPARNGKGRAVVTSFNMATRAGLTPGITFAGIAPSLDEKVAQVLKPGKDWCSRPAYQCGIDDIFGGRMPLELPLENELSTDNDGLESSWRYYLERAAAAAEESDQLGDQYIQAVLDVARDEESDEAAALAKRSEAERELEVVQEVCGLAVDGQQILKWLTPEGVDYGNVVGSLACDEDSQCGANGRTCVGGRCVCTTDQQCDSNYPECVAGQCVRSKMSIVDGSTGASSYRTRLHECLGEDTVYPWVAAGTQPMCFWQYQNPDSTYAAAEVCRGARNFANGNAQCPIYVTPQQGVAPCTTSLGVARAWLPLLQNGAVVKSVPKGLGLFNVTDVIDELAKLRHDKGELFEIGLNTREEIENEKLNWMNALLANPEQCGSINVNKIDISPEGVPPTAQERQDFMNAVGSVLSCQQRALVAGLASRVFANVPSRVVDALSSDAATVGAYPAVGGTYGEKLMLMRAALHRFSLQGDLIKEEFQSTIDDYQTMMTTIGQLGLQHEIDTTNEEKNKLNQYKEDISISILDLQKDAAVIQGTVEAIKAATSFDWINPQSAIGAEAGVVGALLLMDNQLQQLAQQQAIVEAEKRILRLDAQSEEYRSKQQQLDYAKQLVESRTAIRTRSLNIKKYINEMRTAYEEFDSALAGLESERQRALRGLSRAMQSMTTKNTKEQVVDRTLSHLASLRHERYEVSRKNAVRWAVMAKRAIEQRLGVVLADMTEPMPLLDSPPSKWENEVCVSTGMKMNTLRSGDIKSGGSAVKALGRDYVGDYVDRLRRLVESYRIMHGFSDGTDQMVVSLKDDIYRVKENCLTTSRNLLRWSTGIALGSADGNGGSSATSAWIRLGDIHGTSPAAFLANPLDPTTSIEYAAPGATATQTVALAAGDYVLSYYADTSGDGTSVLGLTDSSGINVTPTAIYVAGTASNGWKRYARNFTVTKAGNHNVVLTSPGGTGLAFTAIMLEARTADNDLPETAQFPYGPTMYQDSDGNRKHTVVGCTDQDGSQFRAAHWSRHCVPVCDNGIGTGCFTSIGPERCYWEAEFGLAQRDIERGYILPSGGFALGNFNYRIEELAVNFVGTSLRQCDSTGGQACYGQGFIPYSIVHTGPFTVINHAGDAVPSTLFDGRIEHAKGLALERYLSNPLSSADNSLIEPYRRREFMGRPIDGTYAVRVWEEPGVKFEAIEDLQLLIKYRYWTRLN